MASSEKRCLYEVLGLSKDCSPDEIRSAYRRLALQRHPDKLIKSAGLAGAEATAQFQELVHAYEVLSDPRERAWYDSHRSQILFADHGAKSGGMPGTVPDLFAFYSNTVYSGYSDTGKGFYKIYADLFNSIYQNEVSFARKLGLKMDSVKEAPIMGNLESPYAQVTAFYNYWLGFSTVMDFCWVDQYDVMAGPNRKSRRVMEEENKKLRKKAKRDYNETVRGLAEFVKKRDKRVIDMMVKKNLEMQKKRADERERRKKMEKERLERAMKYEEPEWTKVQEEEEEAGFYEFEYEGDCDKKKNEEFYCIVCSKKFKSEKQWKNHEQSKKHKDKVVELRESLTDLEEELEEEEIDGFQGPCDNVGELHEKLKESLKIDNEEENGAEEVEEEVIGEESETGGNNFDVEEDLNGERGDEDDEMSILKTMALGHKNKKKNVSSKIRVENENDTASVGEFDNQKSTRRNRKGGKEKGKQYCGGAMADTANGVQAPLNECNGDDIVNSTSGTFDQSRKDEEDFLEYDKRKSTRKNRKGKKGREKKNFGEPIAKDINITKSADEDDTQDEYRHMEESHSEAFDRNESVDQMQEFNNKASDHLHDNSRKSKKSSKGKKIKIFRSLLFSYMHAIP